ncbi:MAG: Solvent efflux pump outer membrane protein SrpC [Planctomycetes bacterium]|nr:Solvent efflux pump outer membrane protein SrpC [Planctomycetota bacterium]
MKTTLATIKWPAVGAVLLLTGCVVGPDYVRPDTRMPAAFGELRPESASDCAAAEDLRWWRRFNDPRLGDLVEKAIVANNGVEVAAARLREARAARQIVQSQLSPQLGIGASVLRARTSEAGLGIPAGLLDVERNLFQIGFDASWTLDVFGGVHRQVESAEAAEQATASVRRGVVLMVAAETARAYFELRGVQRELQVAHATLDEQRRTLALTEEKRRNGLASELEVVRARTEVESAAAEVPPLEQAIRQYIHALSTLIALEPTTLRAQLEEPAPIPESPLRLAVGVPSDLLLRRPDIQAAERRLAAATAQVGVATAQFFPRLTLGAAGGLQSRVASDLLNGTGKNGSSWGLAGPFINWTLFDGGRRRAGVELSEAHVAAAKAAYEDTVLTAFREVESALVAIDRGRARIDVLVRLSESARAAAGIALRDYERGILDQLVVLDAQRQANRADMLLADARAALGVHMVALYKALGGGWEVAEPPVVKVDR